jgi:type IV pilus assembly protein PilA
MIVVAIIGILAAIAVPSFIEVQLRAKRAEIAPNMNGIQATELAYHAAFDRFVEAPDLPGTVQKEPVPWPQPAAGFDSLGWRPDGMVRGSYEVELQRGGQDFLVRGRSDIDGDGVEAQWTATATVNAVPWSDVDIY